MRRLPDGPLGGKTVVRLTKRQAAQLFNLSAPLDAELRAVPEKRARDPNAPVEWRIHASMVKCIRERQQYDKELRFLSPQHEGQRDAKRANISKMLGLQRGLPDIWLLRRQSHTLKIGVVEVKVPGGKLSPEQLDWFAWLQAAGVECHRCDNVQEFVRILDAF